MIKYSLLVTISFFLFLGSVCAETLHFSEKEYQTKWCSDNKGVMEYVLPDKTRIDCLLEDYAIEFDFAKKWAEAIGQSLHYAYMTKKHPGIVLIMEDPDDGRYLERLNLIAFCNNIKVWIISPTDLQQINIP